MQPKFVDCEIVPENHIIPKEIISTMDDDNISKISDSTTAPRNYIQFEKQSKCDDENIYSKADQPDVTEGVHMKIKQF
jgi:hypothetical protein